MKAIMLFKNSILLEDKQPKDFNKGKLDGKKSKI